MKIDIYDKYQGKIIEETVPARSILSWIYTTKLGNLIRPFFISKGFSKFYGYIKRRKGRLAIENMVSRTGIKLDDFESVSRGSSIESYRDYHEFFTRKFRPGKRNFDPQTRYLPAPCEARYLLYENINLQETMKVKLHEIDIVQLIGGQAVGTKVDLEKYRGGALLIARLAPQDYHRFHFPGEGEILDVFEIDGNLDTVTDFGIKYNPKVLLRNHRFVSELKLKSLGYTLFIEVGALSVGKIRHTHQRKEFKTLEEKGFFEVGGSTVILVFQKNNIQFDKKLVEYSQKGVECFFQVGDKVGEL